MVQARPSLSNGGGVGKHTHGSLDLGQVSSRHHSWGLVVDSDLEASGTPVDKLDGPLGLDGGNGRVNVLGHNVAAVEHATGHVFSMPGIAFDHLIARLKAGIGNLADGELFKIKDLNFRLEFLNKVMITVSVIF